MEYYTKILSKLLLQCAKRYLILYDFICLNLRRKDNEKKKEKETLLEKLLVAPADTKRQERNVVIIY